MEVFLTLNLCLIAAFILSFSTHMAAAVECYICSWNPTDNQDYADVCSAGHFDPERVKTHECSRGCEIVSMRDPNGDLELYYRNCVANKKITYAYVKKHFGHNEEEVYTCDFDLCNAATVGSPTQVLMLITVLLLPMHRLFV